MAISVENLIKDKKTLDVVTFNKLLRMLLHLDGVMSNAIFDLNQYLDKGGLIRQEIKHNLKEIRKKLKTNLKGNWEDLESDQEFMDSFISNGENFERLVYNFFRLGDSMNINLEVKYPVGTKVWTKHNDKDTLCIVKRIEIQMVVKDNSGKLMDNSYYVLGVLNKDSKETNEIIYKGEESLYKHLKDIKNANL